MIKSFQMRKGYIDHNRILFQDSICTCQTARQYKSPQKVLVEDNNMKRIRKLTPTECERVQSFPPDLTKFGLKKDGTVYQISDSQRYKLCGNAVSSNVSRDILHHIIPEGDVKIMSLFSGCGGTEAKLGERFKIIGHCEIDRYAQDVLRYNHPSVPIYDDVKKIASGEITIPDSFDLLTGGFPCPSWAICGKRKGFEDLRGQLIFDVFDIITRYKPRYILLENVKGILSHEKGESFCIILQELSKLGYDVGFQLVNSCDFGVCQNRERVFIIGKRND